MDGSKIKRFGSQLGLVLTTCLVTVTLMGGGPVGAFSVPNNSVTSAKIVNNTIQSIDIKNGTITNQDLVIGQRIVPIVHRGGAIDSHPIISLNGIQIRVACNAGVEVITVTKSSLVESEISVISNDASNTLGNALSVVGEHDNDFLAGDTLEAGPDLSTATERQYTLFYTAGDGRNVYATFVTEDDIGGNNCLVNGYAVG